MFRPRVIPCLLLKDKGLVKTIKFKDPTYVGDPINAVKIFNDAKADELVFLDITATKEKRIPHTEVIKNIGEEAFMPFAVGGGIKTIDEIRHIINAGAEKVVINTAAIEHEELIKEAADVFGNQSIIVSIDVIKNRHSHYIVYTYGGRKETKYDPVTIAAKMQACGAGEILINSIDKDGTQAGYDIELIKQVSAAVNIPVIACGGAGSHDDFRKAVYEGGASAVAAGSLFVFIGKKRAVLINYPDREDLEKIFSG